MNLEELFEQHPEVLRMPGFDEAIVGLQEGEDEVRLVYAEGKVLEILEAQGMSRSEAEIAGAYVKRIMTSTDGPVFVEVLDDVTWTRPESVKGK